MALTVCSDPRLFKEGQLTGPWTSRRKPPADETSLDGGDVDVVYVNGVWTSAEAHRDRAQAIADSHAGRTVVGLFNPSATLPGAMAAGSASFAEAVMSRHQLSAQPTNGKPTEAEDTDIEETAVESLGDSDDEGVGSIAEIIQSNPRVRLIGYSLGSESIVSALWKVRSDDPDFAAKYRGLVVDLMGAQSIYLPRGPHYSKFVDLNELFAPLQQPDGKPQAAQQPVLPGDTGIIPRHAARPSAGHTGEDALDSLDGMQDGDDDLPHGPAEHSVMGRATYEMLAWFLHDRAKHILQRIHKTISPIIDRVQYFAHKTSHRLRPLVNVLLKTASYMIGRARTLAQRTVEKGKRAAILAARWTTKKLHKAKEWAADKTKTAWKWGTAKAFAAWERITSRLRGIGGVAVERALETARWTAGRVRDAARWTAGRARDAIGWTRDRVRSAMQWTGQRVRDVARWSAQRLHAAVNWSAQRVRDMAGWAARHVHSGVMWTAGRLKNAIGWARDRAGDIRQGIRNTAGWLGDRARGAWDWASGRAQSAWNWAQGRAQDVGQAVHGAWDWASDRAQSAWGWAGDRAHDVGQGIRGAWDRVTGGAQPLQMAGFYARAVGNLVANQVRAGGQYVAGRAGQIRDWVGDRVRGIGSFVGDRVHDLIQGARNTGVWQIARRIAGMTTVGRVVNAVRGVASGIGVVARTIGRVVRPLAGQVIDRVGRFFRPVGSTIHRTVQGIAARAYPLTHAAATVARGVQQTVQRASQIARGALHRVAGPATQAVRRAGQLARGIAQGVSQTAGQVARRVFTTVASGVQRTIQTVGQRVNQVATLPGRIASRAAEMTRPVVNAVRGVGRTLSRLGSWLTGGEEQVQHSGDGPHPAVNPGQLRNTLLSHEGSGFAPVPDMRPALQHAVGFDTGIARLHRGPAAATAARMLNAEAFTIGRDVFFGHGRYDPVTPQGRGLIAHELTHVAQQTGAAGDQTMRYATHEGGNAMEVEAQQARHRMVLASRLGNHEGLYVDRYERHYDAEDGGLSGVDIQRLNQISLEAFRLAEQRAQRDGMTLADPLDELDVDVSLDLDRMSDEEAAALWASAIIARLRNRARSLSRPVAPSPRRPSPMLARSPIQLEPEAPAKEAEGSRTEKTLDEIEGYVGLWFVSPIVEYKIENLWNSVEDLPALIRRNPRAKDLFVKSVDKGAEIDSIAQAAPLVAEFKSAVKQVALNYMARNYANIQQEMMRLGLTPGRETDGKAAQQRAEAHMALVRQMAAQVLQLQGMQRQLREITVGSNTGGGYSHGERLEHETPMKFDPDKPPQHGPEPGSDMVPYAQVKAQWDLLVQGISLVANKNPGIYAMIREEKLGEVANASVFQARESLRAGFTDMLENIKGASGKITDDTLDYRELLPIHQQMFSNRVTGGDGAKFNWSDPFKQAIGQGIVADHQDSEFWKSLGLASLGAALFVVAEVASGGLATAALIGAGGVTAATVGNSLTHYLDMAGASKTATSDDTSLIEQRQVDSARLDLIMNTVGAFLDWAGPAAKLMKGVRSASVVRAAATAERTELMTSLGKLGTMTADDLGKVETRQLLEQSLREFGVDEVVRKSGLSKDALADLLGRESDLGKRILGFTRKEGVLDNLANVKAGKLPRAEADQVILQVIDQYGAGEALKRTGGWKKLSSLLGNDSVAGKQLIAWREAMYRDLEEFIGTQNIKRTGTASKFTNDMDISLLGKEANSDVVRARQFLASRSGVGPDEIEDLLYASFFSDPRRMHLYATLSPELASRLTSKRAAFEMELIWSRRISLAEGSMKQSLIDQANRLGVNWTHFRDLSFKDLQLLKRDVDGLYQALGSAKDVAEQTKLIDAIAEKQALINATEGGGYFSGGGVQRWVSERDQFPSYKPEEPKAWTPAHDLGNVMDQFAKLDETYSHLQPLLQEAQASLKAADVAAALKSVGKYGDRLTSGAKSSLGVELTAGSLDEAAEYFAKLMADEKSGALLASRLVTPEKIMQEMVTAERAIFRIQGASDGLLMELMQRANLAGVSGDFKTIQSATQNQLLLRQVTNGIMEHISALGTRALNALGQGQPQPGTPGQTH